MGGRRGGSSSRGRATRTTPTSSSSSSSSSSAHSLPPVFAISRLLCDLLFEGRERQRKGSSGCGSASIATLFSLLDADADGFITAEDMHRELIANPSRRGGGQGGETVLSLLGLPHRPGAVFEAMAQRMPKALSAVADVYGSSSSSSGDDDNTMMMMMMSTTTTTTTTRKKKKEGSGGIFDDLLDRVDGDGLGFIPLSSLRRALCPGQLQPRRGWAGRMRMEMRSALAARGATAKELFETTLHRVALPHPSSSSFSGAVRASPLDDAADGASTQAGRSYAALSALSSTPVPIASTAAPSSSTTRTTGGRGRKRGGGGGGGGGEEETISDVFRLRAALRLLGLDTEERGFTATSQRSRVASGRHAAAAATSAAAAVPETGTASGMLSSAQARALFVAVEGRRGRGINLADFRAFLSAPGGGTGSSSGVRTSSSSSSSSPPSSSSSSPGIDLAESSLFQTEAALCGIALAVEEMSWTIVTGAPPATASAADTAATFSRLCSAPNRRYPLSDMASQLVTVCEGAARALAGGDAFFDADNRGYEDDDSDVNVDDYGGFGSRSAAANYRDCGPGSGALGYDDSHAALAGLAALGISTSTGGGGGGGVGGGGRRGGGRGRGGGDAWGERPSNPVSGARRQQRHQQDRGRKQSLIARQQSQFPSSSSSSSPYSPSTAIIGNELAAVDADAAALEAVACALRLTRRQWMSTLSAAATRGAAIVNSNGNGNGSGAGFGFAKRGTAAFNAAASGTISFEELLHACSHVFKDSDCVAAATAAAAASGATHVSAEEAKVARVRMQLRLLREVVSETLRRNAAHNAAAATDALLAAGDDGGEREAKAKVHARPATPEALFAEVFAGAADPGTNMNNMMMMKKKKKAKSARAALSKKENERGGKNGQDGRSALFSRINVMTVDDFCAAVPRLCRALALQRADAAAEAAGAQGDALIRR